MLAWNILAGRKTIFFLLVFTLFVFLFFLIIFLIILSTVLGFLEFALIVSLGFMFTA